MQTYRRIAGTAIVIAQLIAPLASPQQPSADRSVVPAANELSDQEVQDTWKQFCANLRSGNRPGALKHMTESSRELYRETLEAMGDAVRRLPDAWSQPQLVRFYGDDLAEYVLTETVDGESRIHVVVFAKSPEGMWLIESL